MPLRDDPEVAMAALRWVLDQAYRPGDCLHIVHVIKCMVQRLEVYHGRCHQACLSVCPVTCCEDPPFAIIFGPSTATGTVSPRTGIPGTSLTFEDPGGMHHEVEDVARAKAYLRER